jgi:glutamyl-tRNA reductase
MTVLPARLPKALHDLARRDHLEEVVVLSTCMRTEIYAQASRFHGALNDIRNFLSIWSGTGPEFFSDHLYDFYDEAAVRHLFRVAAGIDSAVLGEGEILRQVRDAWETARVEEAAGPVLGTLFRQATETGKRVRSETAIARGTTSLSHAAVAMAAEQLGSLAGRTTLVVGAGEMGEAMAAALGAASNAGPAGPGGHQQGPAGPGGHQHSSLLVANRTWSRAVALADRFGGRAIHWGDLSTALASADVLLSSTGSPDLLFEAADLEPVLAQRDGRPLLIVDIAVPRDIDPLVATLPGVTLLDMDDLKAFAEASMAGRRQELPRAEQIVVEEVEHYLEVCAQRQVAPLVVSLRERAEAIRTAELARHTARLEGLDERQAQAVDAMTRAIVAKLLHEPTVNVKTAAGTPSGEQLASALRQLFGL